MREWLRRHFQTKEWLKFEEKIEEKIYFYIWLIIAKVKSKTEEIK